MKKINSLLFTMCLCTSTLLAQDYDNQTTDNIEYKSQRKEMKTVFGRSSKVRGFGSLDVQFTEVRDNLALLTGVHGGIIINNNFILGIGGYGITSKLDFQNEVTNEDRYLYGGYGGLIVGLNFAPKEVIHFSFPVMIGAGGAEVTEDNYWNDNFHDDRNGFRESSAFFFVEPGAELELNLTSFFRLSMGVSYRYVMESDLITLDDGDLSNFNGRVSFKFGKFR